MLPSAMEGKIEDTVDLNLKYPSVTERYWTKYYFIPNNKRRQNGEGEKKGKGGGGGGGGEKMKMEKQEEEMEVVEKGGRGTEKQGEDDGMGALKMREGDIEKKEDTEGIEKTDKESRQEENKGGSGSEVKTGDDTDKEGILKTAKEDRQTENEAENNSNQVEKMDVDDTKPDDDGSLEDDSSLSLSSQAEEGGTTGYSKHPGSHGHVCIMVHTNKLCLVTLSPKHPALAPGMKIIEVSFDVGKFNRLLNRVSGKGKRGAQMMGPQSHVCIITCADGSRHTVLAGVHGKLVEVNRRLLKKPHLVSERPDADGYLAVILPPLRNGDAPLKRLLTSEEYWSQEW